MSGFCGVAGCLEDDPHMHGSYGSRAVQPREDEAPLVAPFFKIEPTGTANVTTKAVPISTKDAVEKEPISTPCTCKKGETCVRASCRTKALERLTEDNAIKPLEVTIKATEMDIFQQVVAENAKLRAMLAKHAEKKNGRCIECGMPLALNKNNDYHSPNCELVFLLCTCIEGNDFTVATQAVVNCPVHGDKG